MTRQSFVRLALRGEAGGVHREAAKEGLEAIREAARHEANDKPSMRLGFSTGFFSDPRTLRVLSRETAGSIKYMERKQKDRVWGYLCKREWPTQDTDVHDRQIRKTTLLRKTQAT